MNGFGLPFDRFGLATQNSDKAVAFLRGLGYDIGAPVYDPLMNVNLILCESKQMPAVEVIFTAKQSGPLDILLKDRNEEIYHLCFRSVNLAASLAAIKNAGHPGPSGCGAQTSDLVRPSESEFLPRKSVWLD